MAPIEPVAHSLLLRSDLKPGERLTIVDFCSHYSLDSSICNRLVENGFSTSSALRRVAVSDLKDMGFKMGEVAELQEAVEMWAQAK
jgi:hypothetical protein